MPSNVTARSKLTVRLPVENLRFVKRYAARHGLTVTEVLDRYLSRLRETERSEPSIHPDVARVTGLVPADVDVRDAYHRHLLRKHR